MAVSRCDFLDNELRPLLIAFPSEMITANFDATLRTLADRLKKRRTERVRRRRE